MVKLAAKIMKTFLRCITSPVLKYVNPPSSSPKPPISIVHLSQNAAEYPIYLHR